MIEFVGRYIGRFVGKYVTRFVVEFVGEYVAESIEKYFEKWVGRFVGEFVVTFVVMYVSRILPARPTGISPVTVKSNSRQAPYFGKLRVIPQTIADSSLSIADWPTPRQIDIPVRESYNPAHAG